MIPSKSSVLALLEEARQASPYNHGWVAHSIVVGDTAGKIAAAINEARSSRQTSLLTQGSDSTLQTLDVNKVTLMGYLHDIGKEVGLFVEHPYNGYRFMQELGYDEDLCRISLTHSFVNNDPFCMFNEFMQPERDKFVIDFIRQHDFTLEEKIISLCDQMATIVVQTVDKRMINIMSRHGVCEHTPERIREVYKLKAYFDELLGYNLYDLFPEIKDNL